MFVISLFQLIIFYQGAILLSGLKYPSSKEAIRLLISAILFSAIYVLVDIHALSALVVPLLILVRARETKDFVNSASCVMYSFLVGLIIEAIIRSINIRLFGGSNLHILAWAIFTLLVCLILRKIFERYGGKNLNRSSQILGMALGGFMLLAYYLLLVATELLELDVAYVWLNLLFFIIYALFTGFIFLLYTRTTQKEIKMREEEVRYKALEEYTDTIETSVRKLRSFRHDYKNLRLSFDHFIKNDDLKGLADYFYKDVESYDMGLTIGNLDHLANLTPSPVKSLIISKLYQADDLGVGFNLEISSDISNLSMSEVDLVRVLGIFLDNAIYELLELGSGKLTISVFELEGSLNIIIANNCSENVAPISRMFEEGFTTKGEGSGIGLANVREILAKYDDVTLSTRVMNNQFIQHLKIVKGGESNA